MVKYVSEYNFQHLKMLFRKVSYFWNCIFFVEIHEILRLLYLLDARIKKYAVVGKNFYGIPWHHKPILLFKLKDIGKISSFQSENFSNWVIGPELGKFIAGIRNDDTSICVHGLKKAWKYASKAGVWKEDDQTLTVKCYEPQDELDIPGFGVRRTTTKLPVTVGLNGKNNLLPLSKASISSYFQMAILELASCILSGISCHGFESRLSLNL